MAQDIAQLNMIIKPRGSIKGGEFSDQLNSHKPNNDCAPWKFAKLITSIGKIGVNFTH
jgi:hypothetical protein